MCKNKILLKAKEFSKSVSSTAHWPEKEEEVDLFPLILLPHLPAMSIPLLSPSAESFAL